MTATVDLNGRVIIVTGASRGIGKALAIGLAGLGASIVCAARSEHAAPGGMPGTIHDTADTIRAAGGAALAVRCDIGNADDIARLVEVTVDEFGGLDVLVNNATTATQVPFAEATPGDWDESMRVNVYSLYFLARSAVPLMAQRGGGSIVNISSHAADHRTSPFMPPGFVIYSVAKAALERFTSALAPEVRPLGVVVNALRPGMVRTEGTEAQFGPDADWTGWSTPADIVAPVATLCALVDTDFTGRILDVSGFGKAWP